MGSLLCSQFWSNFIPNFVSTVLGLVLGFPLALWTNKVMSKAQDTRNEKNKSKRLEISLGIIKLTLSENRIRLEQTASTLKSDEVQFDTQLDISTWDVVKDDLTKVLHDPDLKKRIAYYFSRLTTVVKLNSLYLDFTTGINSAVGGVGATRIALKNHLTETIKFLGTETSEILISINTVLETISTNKE